MDYRKKFVVKPGEKLNLRKRDPAYTGKHESQNDAKTQIEVFLQKLFHQQNLLYAEHKHSILVVLQAIDAGGKDGTIKHVFTALNPQGTRVASFKQPTPAELAHDFLWRVHPHAPGRGEISIFNRSQYEDVLVTRVHKLIDKKAWAARTEHIREFETLLSENGTTIVKFFLHISKDEQLRRFDQRLDDPERQLEDQRVGLCRAGVLGRLYRGLRGRDPRHQHEGSALVRYPLEPQVVPQSGCVADHCRHDGGPEALLPAAFG